MLIAKHRKQRRFGDPKCDPAGGAKMTNTFMDFEIFMFGNFFIRKCKLQKSRRQQRSYRKPESSAAAAELHHIQLHAARSGHVKAARIADRRAVHAAATDSHRA